MSNIRPSVYYGVSRDDDMVVYAGIIEMVIQLESSQGNIGIIKPFPGLVSEVFSGVLTGAGIVFYSDCFRRYLGNFAVIVGQL